MMGVGGRSMLEFRMFELNDLQAKIKMAEALEALEQAIRAEMRTDDTRITRWAKPQTQGRSSR
jgi:hypothetical protein